MKRLVFIPALMALGAAVPGETTHPNPGNPPVQAIQTEYALDEINVINAYRVDYCAYGGTGEDNGGVDPGEKAALALSLKNNMAYPITNVTATLIANFPEAIVLQGFAAYHNIPAGGTADPSEPFWIQMDSYHDGNHPLFWMFVESSEGSWEIPTDTGCAWYAWPLRREFEVWPLNGWSIHGDPDYGSWKSNGDWGHSNETGGKGLCAEGVAAPNEGNSNQELWSHIMNFRHLPGGVLHYRCNFQGATGGGLAYIELSSDAGASWSTIGMESADDGPIGHIKELPVAISERTAQTIIRFRLLSGAQGSSWQIDELYFYWGGPQGPPWSICVPCLPPPSCDTPGDAQLLSPQDGITGVGAEILLAWNPADFADYYEVYAGPQMGQFTLLGTTSGTSFILTGLAEATRYEWMISAINECGFNYSAVRSFTTAGGESEAGHDRPVSPP